MKPLFKKLWYIYTMEYYSAIKKNTFESVPMRWMKLEPIIQSEVSQKENFPLLLRPQLLMLDHVILSHKLLKSFFSCLFFLSKLQFR